MSDGGVLARARAIYLARILCRGDIVSHLLQHGRNVRTGQLPAHMRAVFTATERALLGLRPAENVARASVRHDATGVARGQRVFVWAAGVDAYLAAGRLAGHRPSERDLWAYHAASLGFGRQFGVEGTGYASVQQIETLAARLLGRITLDSVPPGGWVALMQVTNADWFRRDNTATQADVIRAVEETTTPALLAALRRS